LTRQINGPGEGGSNADIGHGYVVSDAAGEGFSHLDGVKRPEVIHVALRFPDASCYGEFLRPLVGTRNPRVD
jgi:hypothetical protein